MARADGGCVRVLCIEHVCAVVLRSTQGHEVYFRERIPRQMCRILLAVRSIALSMLNFFGKGCGKTPATSKIFYGWRYTGTSHRYIIQDVEKLKENYAGWVVMN